MSNFYPGDFLMYLLTWMQVVNAGFTLGVLWATWGALNVLRKLLMLMFVQKAREDAYRRREAGDL